VVVVGGGVVVGYSFYSKTKNGATSSRHHPLQTHVILRHKHTISSFLNKKTIYNISQILPSRGAHRALVRDRVPHALDQKLVSLDLDIPARPVLELGPVREPLVRRNIWWHAPVRDLLVIARVGTAGIMRSLAGFVGDSPRVANRVCQHLLKLMRHVAYNGVEGRIAVGRDLTVDIRDATVFGWIGFIASVRMADKGVHKIIRVRVVRTPIGAQAHIVHILSRQDEIDTRVVGALAEVSRVNGRLDDVNVGSVALEGVAMRKVVIHGSGEFERASNRVVVAVSIKAEGVEPGGTAYIINKIHHDVLVFVLPIAIENAVYTHWARQDRATIVSQGLGVTSMGEQTATKR